jgi:TadE-like protein
MKRISFDIRSGSKGQSFVELSLVALLLMMLVAGIAEFGVLLNRYLNLLDGVREAARVGANADPFSACGQTPDADGVCPEFYQNVAKEAVLVISPIQLNPALHDDIVISFFKVTGDPPSCTRQFTRYPSYSSGYSWDQSGDGYSWFGGQAPAKGSQQSIASIQSQMTDCNAPAVSLLLVEIFYNYPQTLKAPFYEQVFPDPVPVYIYAIMPMRNISN